MTRNPWVNSLAASLYILALVLTMSWGTRLVQKEDTFVAPLVMISLLTLSAAVMAYLFCYQPFVLYFEGKKKQALDLFLKTVGVFGGITIFWLIVLFTNLIKP